MSYTTKISGIYLITSIIDNKYYVGRSYHCNERFSKHKSSLRKNVHNNLHLQYAWNKYGESNFIFDIIDIGDIDILPSLENWWCNMLNVHDRNYGYNVDPTSPFGKIKSSIETIDKIRKSNTGKKVSDETKEKLRIHNLGKKKSPSTIEKLKNRKEKIAVDMYNMSGIFIKTYISLREASRDTNISVKNIRKCMSNEFNLIKGRIFKKHNDILDSQEDTSNWLYIRWYINWYIR